MPAQSFSGKTFVAFIDISGFKAMMQKREKAAKALDKFYSIGYHALSNRTNVNGVFISDCGILYCSSSDTIINKLSSILDVVKIINQEMIENDYLLTTSIAYGDFEYREKIELSNMTKNPLVGNAYLNAYLDNEHGSPKLEAGECRILIDGDFKNELQTILQNQPFLQEEKKHLYFYWMIQNNQTVEQYKITRKNLESRFNRDTKALNDEKFKQITQLLKRPIL